jgi:hypothetical protein
MNFCTRKAWRGFLGRARHAPPHPRGPVETANRHPPLGGNPGIDGGSPNVCMNNNQCAMGQSCINGQCQSSNPGTDGGSSNVCMTSNDCAMGQSCINGRCR